MMFLLIFPMANIMIRDNVNESYVTYLGNIMNQFHKSKIIVIGLGAQISFDGFIEKRKKKEEKLLSCGCDKLISFLNTIRYLTYMYMYIYNKM